MEANFEETNSDELKLRSCEFRKDENVLEVPKSIGLFGGISFIVGTMVGSGIFVSPRGVAMCAGSVGMTIVIWLVSGIVTLLGALCYAELGTKIKLSGADYSYLDKAYGPLVSYQFSWINNVLIKPGQLATVCLTLAEYTTSLFYTDHCGSAPDLVNKLMACLVIVTLGGINVYSVALATKIQILFTIAKLAALTLVIIGGFVMLLQGETQHLKTGFQGTETQIGLIMTGFYSGMWAYDGWNTANFMTEEIKNVERNLPISILIGLPIVIVIFTLTNISYFTVLSVEEMINSTTVALSWANYVIPKASWLVPIFVALSCFGTGNGTMFSGGRLIYAAARNSHLPIILAMVQIRNFSPIPAILLNVLCAIILTFVGNINTLIDLLSFVMWIFYCMNFLAVIIFRLQDEHYPGSIKVPIVIPILASIFAACLVIIPLVVSPQIGYFFALGFILVGYIFYVPFVHLNLKIPFMDSFTVFMQLLFQVFQPEKIVE